MILAVTGHRPNKLGNEYNGVGKYSTYIRQELSKIIKELKPTKMISGMAIGVDMLWAELAIENNIPLFAAIPFLGQEKIWPIESQNRYNNILSKAEESIVVCEGTGYNGPWQLQKRNEWMVDNCDKLIAVWDGTTGGTKNCVKYAEKINKEVIRIKLND